MGALLAILLSAVLPVAPARPTPVDADARTGLVVWSAYDAHSKLYRLMARRDGLTFRVRVAPAEEAFDADAGTDARGRPAIAFVRDGDVHVLVFAEGRERAVPLASTPGVEDVAPSLWHGRLAWGREVSDAAPPVLLTTPIDGGRVATPLDPRLVGGRRGEVKGLEADDRRVALSFARPGEPGDGMADLRVLEHGTVRVLAHVGVGLGGQAYLGPSLDAGTLYAYKYCDGDPGGCEDGTAGVLRLRPGARRLERVMPDVRPLHGFAVAGGVMWRVRCGEVHPRCTLKARPVPEMGSSAGPVRALGGAAGA
jgi:hypothetical protein